MPPSNNLLWCCHLCRTTHTISNRAVCVNVACAHDRCGHCKVGVPLGLWARISVVRWLACAPPEPKRSRKGKEPRNQGEKATGKGSDGETTESAGTAEGMEGRTQGQLKEEEPVSTDATGGQDDTRNESDAGKAREGGKGGEGERLIMRKKDMGKKSKEGRRLTHDGSD
jgi:hypothetical protein